jgi:hypothetical protein
MVRPVKSFDTIFNAVVMELQRTQGTKVTLTLEIEAKCPNGVSDASPSLSIKQFSIGTYMSSSKRSETLRTAGVPTSLVEELQSVEGFRARCFGPGRTSDLMTPTSQYSCCSTHFSQSDLHRRNNPRWGEFTPRRIHTGG